MPFEKRLVAYLSSSRSNVVEFRISRIGPGANIKQRVRVFHTGTIREQVTVLAA